jgi:hypothetical protein
MHGAVEHTDLVQRQRDTMDLSQDLFLQSVTLFSGAWRHQLVDREG